MLSEAVTDSQDITSQTIAGQIPITTIGAKLEITFGVTQGPDLTTAFEDSPGINTKTSTESTSEATEELDAKVRPSTIDGAVFTVQYVEPDSPKDSEGFEPELHTTFEDSPRISTNAPTLLASESPEDLDLETKLEVGAGATESPDTTEDVTIEHLEVDVVSSEATIPVTTERTQVALASEVYEPDLFTTFEEVLNPPEISTGEETELEVEHDATEASVVSDATIQDVVSEVMLMATDTPLADSSEMFQVDVQDVLTEKPVEMTPTNLAEILPDAFTNEGVVEMLLTTLPTVHEIATDGTGEDALIDIEDKIVPTTEETLVTFSQSIFSEEEYLGKVDDIITEIPEDPEVTTGDTHKVLEETTEATAGPFEDEETPTTKGFTPAVEDISQKLMTEAPEVTWVTDKDTETVSGNTPKDFVESASDAIEMDGTEGKNLEELPEESMDFEEISTLSTPEETDIVESVTKDIGDALKEVTPEPGDGVEGAFEISEDTLSGFTEVDEDILTTTDASTKVYEVIGSSEIPQDTHKVVEEVITVDPLPEVITETFKVVTEISDVIIETTSTDMHSEVITETREVTSELLPEIVSETSETIPEIKTETPDVISDMPVDQPELMEDENPTPNLKVEDITVVENIVTTTIQKTFSTTLQTSSLDISNDILDEDNVVSAPSLKVMPF